MTIIRSQIVAQARWGIAEQPQVHYAEVRPIPLSAYKAHKLPLTTDCSGYVTCCYYAAGAPDPNGLGYNGEGYTGTLLTHLPHITRAEAQAGDLLVFGAYPGVHVVMLLEPGNILGGDPQVASHGTEWEPRALPLSSEAAGFPGRPQTYLRGVPAAAARPARSWDIVDMRGRLVGITHHPVRWGILHPRAFRNHAELTFKERR